MDAVDQILQEDFGITDPALRQQLKDRVSLYAIEQALIRLQTDHLLTEAELAKLKDLKDLTPEQQNQIITAIFATEDRQRLIAESAVAILIELDEIQA